MPHIKILNSQEIKEFDFPPKFNGEERKQFLNLSKWAIQIIEDFGTPINKIGFMIQLGYFKATRKFFTSRKFHKNDIEFIAKRLNLSIENIDFSTYKERTVIRHREIILEHFGFQKFNEQSKFIVIEESLSLALRQTKPRFMFWSLVDFIRQKKVEVPSYYLLAEVITNALNKFEKILLNSLEKHITIQEKQILDELLDVYKPEENQQIKQYKLTLLKKSSQSLKPRKIKENIEDFKYLQTLFNKLKPIIDHLSLSPEIIKYYAVIIIKSQIFQITRREENKYLLLIAFIIHQYYSLTDTLVDIIIQSVQSNMNTCKREYKENFYEEYKSKCQTLNGLLKNVKEYVVTVQEIQKIVNTQELSNDEKIKSMQLLFSKENNCSEIQNQIQSLEKDTGKIAKNSDYYDILEAKSIKLQNRVSQIIKYLIFDNRNSNKKLITAINYYKRKNGSLDSIAPVSFLDTDEQEFLFDDKGKLRVSLYKILLFQKIASAIKSGSLNICNSYKYKSFDEYLIPKNKWKENKEDFLNQTNLIQFKDYQQLESELMQEVKEQYKTTNDNINSEKNKYVKFTPHLNVSTPKVEKEPSGTETDLFAKNDFTSVFEVLHTINGSSKFLDSFEHWQIKHNHDKPSIHTFLAGIISYGCNLGVRKLSKTSRNINQNQLENTINWYFSVDNINNANNKILELTEKLQLPIIYRREKDKNHTSSDGQKFNIAVDSLNANYSYKYFGKGKGITINTFIDESHRLTYSDVISSSEREAGYVIDGLMNNDVIQSDIHSTDTHGYSEIIFAVTHLLGISFAPRIKNFKDQQLYSFEEVSSLKASGYKTSPVKKINSKLIADNWDSILHLIATIKSNTTTASQLLRKLSSYSCQTPLYKALKEFGRIIKTLFILKYIDDVKLRQAIEKQLNKGENAQKFAKAIFYGNNQEFQHSTKDEQLIAEGCKRLIENAIICWNYLYLSQQILEAKNEDHRQNLIRTIKNSSVITWQHINLQGEFDFSEESFKNSFKFTLPEILTLKVA